MAATGLHIEPITIISELIAEGYPEAVEVLEDPLIRNDLREVRSRHWPANNPRRTEAVTRIAAGTESVTRIAGGEEQ